MWNLLPENILFKIFEYCRLLDVVTCEDVCQYWKLTSQKYFASHKELCLHEILYSHVEGLPFRRFNYFLELILSRCFAVKSLQLASLPRNRNVSLRTFVARYELTITALGIIFKECPNLEQLDLSHHILPNEVVFEYLAQNLPSTLRVLTAENCRLDVVNEGWIQRSPDSHRVDDLLSFMFARLPKLEKLSLHGTCNGFFQVSTSSLESLPKNLMHLDLSGGYAAKLQSLNFVKPLHNLQSLYIERSRISQDDVGVLVSHCPNLHHLELAYCHNVVDFGIVSSLKKIEWLSLDGNRENLHDEALIDICQNCPNIRVLSVENARLLSDTSLKELARLKNIRTLRLSSVVKMTDESLKEICQNCSKLQELHVKFCKKITSSGLYWIAQLKNITTLYVSGLVDFSQNIFDAIASSTRLKRCEAFGCSLVSTGRYDVFLSAQT